jgi:hypothetical protein
LGLQGIEGIGRFWTGLKAFFWPDFSKAVQRRGVHVNIPEIGSRDGEIVFGGILGICAELRRKFKWGNWKLGFFEDLLWVPRGVTEEGGPFMCQFVYLEEFWGSAVLC